MKVEAPFGCSLISDSKASIRTSETYGILGVDGTSAFCCQLSECVVCLLCGWLNNGRHSHYDISKFCTAEESKARQEVLLIKEKKRRINRNQG